MPTPQRDAADAFAAEWARTQPTDPQFPFFLAGLAIGERKYGEAESQLKRSLRLEPEKLERLKIIAARKRIRVNDLLLEGVDHVLALHSLGTAA